MECAAETLTLRWPTHYTQDSCTKPCRAEYCNKASKYNVRKSTSFFICLFDTFVYGGGTEHILVLTPVGAGVETRHS